ncbi:hypothetical protein LTR99_006431 [Exophiala xenobiotica]|uniref:Uncharacterized protein n=1 Tax=Vermiconidia calcicola TaxID=1690605 RepID=A0AAV9QAJ9_9PEZI|nr:hypothetical protein LTR40_006899 [Exophiala xenobiotica]KAK5301464.1 hypothetical protein LTR99_006431 [Exophiala xenobiotica]KAK5536920.1 hypothetical protein LTR23_007768 [Chaetothyriales sp. CCFEE 6169]KAK5537601.1 hypothetical protein LTR25_004853 [Vermiconidia calcicola]KAK5556501.1 hypothetical protein LTR46_005693 [Exophiala xenobiotica]
MANNGIKPVWHIAAYRFSTTSGRTQVAEREYVVAVAKTYRQTDSTAIILGYRRLSLANNPPILYPCQTPRTCITMETGIAIFIAVMAIVVALVCVWALYTINNRPARFFPGHTHRLWYQMEAPQRGTSASRPGGHQGGQEELAV